MDRWRGGSSGPGLSTILDRVVLFCELIAEAHELGRGPGDLDPVSSFEFHTIAARSYAVLLPMHQRRSIAVSYRAAASKLDGTHPPGSVRATRDMVCHYLLQVALSLGDPSLPEAADPVVENRDNTELLPLLPCTQLAEIASAEAIRALHRAAVQLLPEYELGERSPIDAKPVLSAEDIRVVRAIAEGLSMTDIALMLGWSERTLFRRTKEIWVKLGASNRSQGIAIATRLGIVEPGAPEEEAPPPPSGGIGALRSSTQIELNAINSRW